MDSEGVFPSLRCVFQSPWPWFVDRFRRLQHSYFSVFRACVSFFLEVWSASDLVSRHGVERPVTKVDETFKCVSRRLLKLLQAKMLRVRLSLDNVILEALMALILQGHKTSKYHIQVVNRRRGLASTPKISQDIGSLDLAVRFR